MMKKSEQRRLKRIYFNITKRLRLGAEQQARIMSGLLNNLKGMHYHVKRYNAGNDETFSNELAVYIKEENARRSLPLDIRESFFCFIKHSTSL